jgi:hypothetical protein
MKLMTTLTRATGLCVAAAGASAQEKVVISDLNWTGAKAIAHVIKAVIEGPLDSEVEIIEGLSDQAIIGAGMDKGDGSADAGQTCGCQTSRAHGTNISRMRAPCLTTSPTKVVRACLFQTIWLTRSHPLRTSRIRQLPRCSTRMVTAKTNTGLVTRLGNPPRSGSEK